MDNTYEFSKYLSETKIRHKIGTMTILSNNLKKLRQARGLKQDEMADKLGILRTNYVPYENKGGPPSDEMLQKIAKILEVPFEELLTYKEADRIQANFRPEAIELASETIQKLKKHPTKELIQLQRNLSELVKEHEKK